MIDPEERLWAGGGNLLTRGPYTWYITDFDTRRNFSVTYSPPTPIESDEDLEATQFICLTKLQQHIDDLDADVLGIRFSDPNGPVTISTDINDDANFYTNCHQLPALRLPFVVKTINIENLAELERLGPEVDLVTHSTPPTADGIASVHKCVFKYWFMPNGMFRKWYELQCWSRLPRDHPHIVPFDAVVIDTRGGVAGFTSLYIPGGSLWHNNATSRAFRLEWLRQLLSVIDDLNYRYGIMHQDVAPRNLLIDPKDNLCIFDFNYAIMIKEHYSPERDDIKGAIFTLYEIITLDGHFREEPHEQQDAEALLHMEWTKHADVKLDSDVQDFRRVLDDWVAKRKSRGGEFPVLDTCIHWPWMPDGPEGPTPLRDLDGTFTGKEWKPVAVFSRRDLVKMEEPYWNWERPASYRLKDVLAEKECLQDELNN